MIYAEGKAMYIKIGPSFYIDKERIIGIFDMDTATVAASTRAFLTKAQKEGRVSLADEDIPKSFLLVDGKTSKRKKYKKRDYEAEKRRLGQEIILCKPATSALYGRLGAPVGEMNYEDE